MYKCEICNSEDIEQQMWVNMNTGKASTVIDEGDNTCFCNKCEMLSSFKWVKSRTDWDTLNELYSTLIYGISELK